MQLPPPLVPDDFEETEKGDELDGVILYSSDSDQEQSSTALPDESEILYESDADAEDEDFLFVPYNIGSVIRLYKAL